MTEQTPPGINNESHLIIISILLRIYDVQMAILTELNEDVANRVYEGHEKGEIFGPKQTFIPSIEEI